MPVPYGLIIKDLHAGLTFETLPEVLSASAPVILVVGGYDMAPLLRWGEQVEIVPKASVRAGDLVLTQADSEILLAWVVSPLDEIRWQVRQYVTGVEAVAAPLARVTRLLKHEGLLSLDRGWGAMLGWGLARLARSPRAARALIQFFEVAWRCAHPIWPPLTLGPPDQLGDTVRRAYDERLTVDLYGSAGGEPVLGPHELDAVQRFKPGSRILDIGCGAGREAIALARLGHQVTAIDISPGMLEIARRNAEREGLDVRFELVAMQKFDAPPGSFDGVYVSQEVYSYIPGRQQRIAVLRRIRRVLTDDGVLLLFQSVFQRPLWGRSCLVDLLRRIAKAVARWEVSELGDAWSAEGSHGLAFKHYFFSTRELHLEIRAGGFRVENVVEFCQICRPA